MANLGPRHRITFGYKIAFYPNMSSNVKTRDMYDQLSLRYNGEVLPYLLSYPLSPREAGSSRSGEGRFMKSDPDFSFSDIQMSASAAAARSSVGGAPIDPISSLAARK